MFSSAHYAVAVLALGLSRVALGLSQGAYLLVKWGPEDPRSLRDFYSTRGCLNNDGLLVGFKECAMVDTRIANNQLIVYTKTPGQQHFCSVDEGTMTLGCRPDVPAQLNLNLPMDEGGLLSYAYAARADQDRPARFYFDRAPARGKPTVLRAFPRDWKNMVEIRAKVVVVEDIKDYLRHTHTYLGPSGPRSS